MNWICKDKVTFLCIFVLLSLVASISAKAISPNPRSRESRVSVEIDSSLDSMNSLASEFEQRRERIAYNDNALHIQLNTILLDLDMELSSDERDQFEVLTQEMQLNLGEVEFEEGRGEGCAVSTDVFDEF